MQFTVPKFLERESKIVGFLTFKQMIYLGIVGLIFVFLWFIVSHGLFFVLLGVLGSSAVALFLVKIKGVPLNELLIKYFSFLGKTKVYIWRKKESLTPIKVVKIKKQKEKKEETRLKLAPESKIRKLSSELELGIK
ncbi:PrgI family protein [bacterium]|nr:PrgI family protein [bacterium]